jgi:uncharacterized protein involved in exopolysaccharide biosynthesis
MFSLFRRALVRHWRLAGLAAATIYLLVLLVAATTPRVYCSSVQLSVTSGHESEIPTLVEICRSDSTLERLVVSLGPEYARISRGKPNLLSVRQRPSWVDFTLPHENTFSIECRAKLPVQAQQLATCLSEICIEHSPRLPSDAGSNLSLDNDTAQAKADWDSALGRLAEAKSRAGGESIGTQRQEIDRKIADTEAKIQATRSNLTAAEDRILALGKQIARMPETEATPTNPVAPESELAEAAATEIQGELESLEARERQLAEIRSDDHPQLVSLRQQIADLRATLAKRQKSEMPAPPSDSLSRADLQQQLERELNEIAAFCQLEEVLADQAAALKDDLEQVRSDQAKALARLEREVSAAQQRYQDQLAESGRNDLAASTGTAILAVVQGPTLPTAPEYPQPTAMLTMGLVGGVLCGFGSALVAAMFRRVLRDCAQLEQVLDLPVVGVLPCSASELAAAS